MFLTTFLHILETKVVVDIEKNKSISQEIRTLAKFEFFVKNIILELFKEGPDEVNFVVFSYLLRY